MLCLCVAAGVVVNAAVVSDAKSPTADGATAVRGPGHLRSASAAVAATGASIGGSSAAPHQHVRAQSAPAVVDANHEALLVLITQKDVAAVKKHVQQYGVSQLFAVDSRKKTPIEIAFTEGANCASLCFAVYRARVTHTHTHTHSLTTTRVSMFLHHFRITYPIFQPLAMR